MTRTPTTSLTVTAIIPVYNGASHIASALSSVFQQTQLPDELIVIDDGSTDDSIGVVRAWISGDLPIPITVLTQPNQGQSAARNHAAAAATGDLLAFLDQDDTWHPAHLARLTKPFASKPRLGWAYSDFDEIDGAGNTVTQGYIASHRLVHPKRTLVQFLEGDLMMLPSASVIRRSAFAGVGGFDPALSGYEDDDLFVRLFRAGWGSAFIDRRLARFRVHGGSSSTSARFRTSRITFLDKLLRDVVDDHRMNRYYIRDLVMPRLYRTTFGDYATALRCGDDAEALRVVETIEALYRRSPGGPRRGAGLWLLRRPRLFRRFLAVCRLIPRPLRPAINEALLAVRTGRPAA